MGENPVSYSRSSVKDGDFEEEDVWFYATEMEGYSNPALRRSKENGGSSSNETKMARQSSSPVKIPDWPEIYGKKATLGTSPRNGSWVYDGNGSCIGYEQGNYHQGDDEDDYGDDMVPPHEWLARKISTSRIPSFSVCEGIGRTLKGRDLSRLRHVVLTKTGFLQ